MPQIQRVGDTNSAGGVITSGIDSVRINGRPVAVPGRSVSAHPPCGQRRAPPGHCSAVTTGGTSSVRAGGQPIIVTGSADSCGHARSGGSADVRIG